MNVFRVHHCVAVRLLWLALAVLLMRPLGAVGAAEDKARLDKEFKETQKKVEDKLSQEKSYEKWVYLVSNWTVDSLLKERAQLLVEKKEEPKKDAKPAATDSSKEEDLPALPAVPKPDDEKK